MYLCTLNISCQYHVVFDDEFTTVDLQKTKTLLTSWPDLLVRNREKYTEKEYTLDKEWSHVPEKCATQHTLDDASQSNLEELLEQAIAELKEQSTPSEGEQTKNQIGEDEGAWPHEQVTLSKRASENKDSMDQYNPILMFKVPELFQYK